MDDGVKLAAGSLLSRYRASDVIRRYSESLQVASSEWGAESLHSACENGHDEAAEYLISTGADIEALDKLGATPFLKAVSSGKLKVINVLCRHRCNIKARDDRGDGALALASAMGHLKIAERLVYMGLGVNEVHADGHTSLHWACREGNAEIAAYLISVGAYVEARDKDGMTPFLRAVLNGKSDVMRVLFEHGCNISSRTYKGHGALALASQSGHLEIAKQLIKMGLNVNEISQNGYTSLHWACQKGHVEIVRILVLAGAELEAVDKWGMTPFLRTAFNGNPEVMRFLIEEGCNTSAKDKGGNRAMTLACSQGHLKIATQLADAGFGVNEPNNDDDTPLHLACREGHAKTAEFLILAKADIEVKNKFDRTPLLEAKHSNRDDVVTLLKNFTATGRQTLQVDLWKDESLLSYEDNFQEIYDEALKHGSVTVNRSHVIVVGQDGVGKSCLVDSLLNRPFERNKASTEGAVVEMTHTTARGWKATDNKDHLDSLVAEGVYRMNQQQSMSKSSQEGPSESSHFVMESNDPVSRSEEDEAGKPEHHYGPSTLAVETLAGNLKTVGMEAKTLTTNQQQLSNTFLKNKLSEEELKKHILGVRDIWDLGGQEVYLATHSALVPDNTTFGLTIYIVVMDISKSLSNRAESSHRSSDGEVINLTNELGWTCRNGDFPLYWFGSITAAHEETKIGEHWLGKDEEVVPPPVFAIGSHRDVLDSNKERFPDSESVEKWLRGQGELFEQLLGDSNFMKHIVLPKKHGVTEVDEDFREMVHFVNRIFLVDNSTSGSKSKPPCKGVNEIRDRVDCMTTTYWKGMKKQPLFWVYLEILLFRWSKYMKTVVAEVDEIAKLAQDPTICDISSREEVEVALKYLANVGAILYYPEVDGLKDVVFTSPEWVIKALSAFVTAAKPGPFLEQKWIDLKKNGVMSNDLMEHRLKQMRSVHSNDFEKKKIEDENRLIVRLLELLDVITPVEGSPKTDFYVPSMLKTPFLYSPTYWERLTSSDSEPSRCNLPGPLIVIPTKLKFVPECLFFRLIIRFLKVYPNRPRLSRHQCIFLVEDKDSPVEVEVELLYHSRGKWVALTIHFIDEEEDPKIICEQFLATIKNDLCKQMKSVCQQGMRGFKYSICCQTKKAVRKDEEFGIDFKSLPVIFDGSPSPPSNILKFYNPFREPLAVKRDDFQINCWFGRQLLNARLSSSQDALPEVVNKPLIRAVATQVKVKWEMLAVCLEQSALDIPQYQEKSKDNFIRAMMVIEGWVAKCSQKAATVDALLRACEKCGIHRENVETAYREEVKQSQ